METVELGLDEIKVDFSTYGYRKQKDMLRVQQYQEILDVLPPVDVFDTPLGMVLVAGHHRYDAYIKERRQKIKANLHQGTEAEAKLFAIKSNVVHGLPLTRAERKQALRDFILISKGEDPKISDRDIATAFGACSRETVRRERRELVKEELLPFNTDELANLDGYITQHSQMLDAEIADVFGCHRSTVFRRRQDLLDSGVLEPESVAGDTNVSVQQNEENDDQGDLFQTGGEAESTSASGLVDPEQYIRQARELSADYPDGPDSRLITTDEYIERVEEGLINNPESGIEVEFDGQRINTLDDLVNVRTPDEKLMDQLYDLSIQVTKASQLVDEFKEYPLSRVVSVLSESHRLVETLGSRLAMAEEITGYYRELINERRKS